LRIMRLAMAAPARRAPKVRKARQAFKDRKELRDRKVRPARRDRAVRRVCKARPARVCRAPKVSKDRKASRAFKGRSAPASRCVVQSLIWPRWRHCRGRTPSAICGLRRSTRPATVMSGRVRPVILARVLRPTGTTSVKSRGLKASPERRAVKDRKVR
jgi:hypothetical protein